MSKISLDVNIKKVINKVIKSDSNQRSLSIFITVITDFNSKKHLKNKQKRLSRPNYLHHGRKVSTHTQTTKHTYTYHVKQVIFTTGKIKSKTRLNRYYYLKRKIHTPKNHMPGKFVRKYLFCIFSS